MDLPNDTALRQGQRLRAGLLAVILSIALWGQASLSFQEAWRKSAGGSLVYALLPAGYIVYRLIGAGLGWFRTVKREPTASSPDHLCLAVEKDGGRPLWLGFLSMLLPNSWLFLIPVTAAAMPVMILVDTTSAPYRHLLLLPWVLLVPFLIWSPPSSRWLQVDRESLQVLSHRLEDGYEFAKLEGKGTPAIGTGVLSEQDGRASRYRPVLFLQNGALLPAGVPEAEEESAYRKALELGQTLLLPTLDRSWTATREQLAGRVSSGEVGRVLGTDWPQVAAPARRPAELPPA